MVKIKYEKGDLVTVTQNLTKHRFPIGKIVKIFRVQPPSWYDCSDDTGDCCLISKSEIQLYTINKTNMTQMKDAVLTVAKQLAKANNTVTTLEIKLQLRRDYPYFYWTQDVVSRFMDVLAGDGLFTYVDSTTIPIHRIYSLVSYTLTKTANKARTITINHPSKSISQTVTKGYIKRNNLFDYVLANRRKITHVCTKTGKVLSINQIKSQKKSLIGYVNLKKNSLQSLTVDRKEIKIA